MNNQDQCEAKNQPTNIEDLTINPEQAAEVKGGESDDDRLQWIKLRN